MSSPGKLSDFEDTDKNDDLADEGHGSDKDAENKNSWDDKNTDDSKKRRIDPTSMQKKIMRNPQPKLDAQRLKGPKGIHTIEQHFHDFKFCGKGYEKSDLNKLMKKLEYWSHRLFPKYEFDDCLSKVEALGAKKPVQTHVTKIRLGMLTNNDVMQNISEDDDEEAILESAPIDEFDALIAEELEKQRQSMTPQHHSASIFSAGFDETCVKITNAPSRSADAEITADMKERMERNRQLAIQKRLARLEAEEAKKKIAMQQQSDDHEASADKETTEHTPSEEIVARTSPSDEK